MKILFWEWKNKTNNQQTFIRMRMSLICIIENMVVHRELTMNYINRINRFNGWYLLIQLSSAQFNSVQFGLNLTCFGRHSIGKYSLCEFSLHLPAGTIFCVCFFCIAISIYSQWIFEDYIARLNFNGRERVLFLFSHHSFEKRRDVHHVTDLVILEYTKCSMMRNIWKAS